MSTPDTITNRPFDTLKPGDGARIERRVSVGDMRGFTTHAADITDTASTVRWPPIRISAPRSRRAGLP